jgi:hypothetical protein
MPEWSEESIGVQDTRPNLITYLSLFLALVGMVVAVGTCFAIMLSPWLILYWALQAGTM